MAASWIFIAIFFNALEDDLELPMAPGFGVDACDDMYQLKDGKTHPVRELTDMETPGYASLRAADESLEAKPGASISK